MDVVLSILLQSNIPTGQAGKPAAAQQALAGTTLSTSDLSGSSRRLNPNGTSQRLPGKRKDLDSTLSLSLTHTHTHTHTHTQNQKGGLSLSDRPHTQKEGGILQVYALSLSLTLSLSLSRGRRQKI